MPPFPGKLLQLVEQLAPNLPVSARDVLRKALGSGSSSPASDAPPTFPCLASPGLATSDLSALLRRFRPGRTPDTGRQPSPDTSEPGTFTRRTASTPSGTYGYRLFQPEGSAPPTALVVMLHGCTQNPEDFAAGTRMNAVAQRHNILVAYPEQTQGANVMRCWNWFLPEHQKRGGGEAAAIAAITQGLMSEFGIAAGHVFVAGLSAGGAMAAIMAEVYPDLYGAVGIHSGLATRAAHDVSSALTAMRSGTKVVPNEAGALAAGIPTIVFHGDADTTVHPNNADAIVARVNAREGGLTPVTEKGRTPSGRAYVKTSGSDSRGRVRFESWTVQGAGHAWAGGSSQGSYTDPAGPDASSEMMRFFLQQAGDRGGLRASAA